VSGAIAPFYLFRTTKARPDGLSDVLPYSSGSDGETRERTNHSLRPELLVNHKTHVPGEILDGTAYLRNSYLTDSDSLQRQRCLGGLSPEELVGDLQTTLP